MIIKSIEDIQYLQFEHLADFSHIRHAILTRNGGTSPPPFDNLNIGYNVNDTPDAVNTNRRKITQAFKMNMLVSVRQIHSDRVIPLTKANDRLPEINNSSLPLGEADAVVTDLKNKPLLIQTADCQAILLFDPVQNVIGNVHSGWRGSVQNIAAKTVKTMQQLFNCNPSDILAGIGPSLGPCCAQFVNYQKELPQSFWPYQTKRHYFDFWSISRDQLIEAGLKNTNINTSGLCSSCRTDLFFSYRKEKITGRFGALLAIIK